MSNTGVEESGKYNRNALCANDDDNPIAAEYKVYVCHPPENAEFYNVDFPTQKFDPLGVNTRIRFKRNAKLLESRVQQNLGSASFDVKRLNYATKKLDSMNRLVAYEDIYMGRATSNDFPVEYAAAIRHKGAIYLLPISGRIEMRHFHANSRDEPIQMQVEGYLSESESEAECSTSNSLVRVRFGHVETEKQKQRREEGAAHRNAIIQQDEWITVDSMGQNKHVMDNVVSCLHRPQLNLKHFDPERLVDEVILGNKLCTLNLDNCHHSMSLRKIRRLPVQEQIKALIFKTKLISTKDIKEFISVEVDNATLFSCLREYANVVCGIWVIKSELVFPEPMHAVHVMIRDFALCLFDSKLPVIRFELKVAFRMDIDGIDFALSTIANRCEEPIVRSWRLRISEDIEFGTERLSELRILIDEKKYWQKRWKQINEYLCEIRKDRSLKAMESNEPTNELRGGRPSRRKSGGRSGRKLSKVVHIS